MESAEPHVAAHGLSIEDNARTDRSRVSILGGNTMFDPTAAANSYDVDITASSDGAITIGTASWRKPEPGSRRLHPTSVTIDRHGAITQALNNGATTRIELAGAFTRPFLPRPQGALRREEFNVSTTLDALSRAPKPVGAPVVRTAVLLRSDGAAERLRLLRTFLVDEKRVADHLLLLSGKRGDSFIKVTFDEVIGGEVESELRSQGNVVITKTTYERVGRDFRVARSVTEVNGKSGTWRFEHHSPLAQQGGGEK